MKDDDVPTPLQDKLLREIAGQTHASPWGAWVGVCMSGLRGIGMLTRQGEVTDKGREYLAANPKEIQS